MFYRNTEGFLCYRNLFSQNETQTKIHVMCPVIMSKCISSFADFVAVIICENARVKTLLYKTTFQKVEEVAKVNGSFWFDAGVFRSDEEYFLPTQRLLAKPREIQFETQKQYYNFLETTSLKTLINKEMIEYQIKYLLSVETMIKAQQTDKKCKDILQSTF